MASTNLKEKWDRTHLCGSIYGEHCEHLMYATQEKNEYNNKALDIYCVYCTANGTARKIGGAATWTGLSPKYCYKRHNQEITEDKTMAFDFTNIKAKGKLNGLSSFSSLPAEDDTVKITPIPIDMIDPYTESLHPFKSYTVDKIDELAESIKVNGLLQPIIVSRKSDGRYMIIAGHNRFRACQKNNMDTIDAVVRNELTATQRKLMMVDTNLEQRHKLTAKERALAYKIKQDCLKELGATNPTAVIAKENGESRKSVQRYIAISRLTPELLDMVDTDRIKLSVGVTVSAVDTETQNSLSEYLISEGEKATVDEKQAKEIQLEATVKPLSVDDIAEILEKKPQKEKKQSDIIKIHYADIADSVMGLPKEEIEPLVRWLLTNNKAQIADYCNDKGFVSVAETTADSDAESIDGILMDDNEEFDI